MGVGGWAHLLIGGYKTKGKEVDANSLKHLYCQPR